MLPLLALLGAGLAAPATSPAAPPALSSEPVRLTGKTGPIVVQVVYHGTVRIEAGGKVLWIDPWSKGKLDGPKADLVLITDIHADHLDMEAISTVGNTATLIVAPAAVVAAQPLLKVNHVLANGQSVDVAGAHVEAVPMYNLQRGPSTGTLFHDKGRGNGYLLSIDGKKIYLAGDTECTPEMGALKDVDLALIPMNLPYTMTPGEAAACVAAFKPRQVVPYHYSGSDLSLFTKALKEVNGVEVLLREAYPGGLPG